MIDKNTAVPVYMPEYG